MTIDIYETPFNDLIPIYIYKKISVFPKFLGVGKLQVLLVLCKIFDQ